MNKKAVAVFEAMAPPLICRGKTGRGLRCTRKATYRVTVPDISFHRCAQHVKEFLANGYQVDKL